MGPRLLLIEDDRHLGPTLTTMLGRRGYVVFHATCIDDARRAIEEVGFEPEIVLTDRDVPDGDAWSWVLENAPTASANIVFMSGRPPDVIPPLFFEKGVDSLTKLWRLLEGLP